MKSFKKIEQGGAVLVVALVSLLLMSMLGATLLKTGLFHEKMATNNRLDALTFQAAESGINATIHLLNSNSLLRNRLMAGAVVDTCLTENGAATEHCQDAGISLDITDNHSSSVSPAVEVRAQTRYRGASPVPGYAADLIVYHQFTTEGRAYYPESAPLPFGHLNLQVWQTLGSNSAVLNQ